MARRGRTVPGDAGSAVVDTVLVSIILTLLFLGVVQLALILHVRNVLVDAAGEGARTAALPRRDLAAGTDRTRTLVSAALTDRFAQDVTADVEQLPGADVVVVSIRAPLPVLGLVGPRTLAVSGRALVEGP